MYNILDNINWKVNGVCHVGAYDGKEVTNYIKHGVKLVVWVEPNYLIFNELIQNTKNSIIGNIYLPLLLSDKDNENVPFYLTNNGESSSVCKFGKDINKFYPELKVVNELQLLTTRFDTYVNKQSDFSWEHINVLIVDTQGSELNVLKGFGDLLSSKNLKLIQSEVNFVDLYKNNPSEEDINNYLSQFGFVKKYWFKVNNGSWGDISWVRE